MVGDVTAAKWLIGAGVLGVLIGGAGLVRPLWAVRGSLELDTLGSVTDPEEANLLYRTQAVLPFAVVTILGLFCIGAGIVRLL